MFNTDLLNGESELQYIWRLGQAKENGLLDMTWDEIATLINKAFREDETVYRSESAYRKRYNNAKDFNTEVFSKENRNNELDKQIRELERKKIQFRDERTAWQRQNYIDARVENKLDLLESTLSQLGRTNFETHDKVDVTSDNDMLIVLSDFHIGQCFNSVWGEYNSNIAAERLNKLLNEVIAIRELHNSEKCYAVLCGDMISGSIHKSLQVTNRENVIEQIKIATELISSFCYELSKHFSNVFISSVVGNHTRIERKEDSLHDERLDDIITWGVGLSLQHITNIHMLKRNLDVGIADLDIRGKFYTVVHGDYDLFSKSGTYNLCSMLGYFPYALISGHMHTCAVDEANGVKMIRGGTLAGSGDQFTIEKRLSGKPSQMVCICNQKGVACYYPIELV